MKRKTVKNLQIFGTVIALAISSFSINKNVVNSTAEFNKSIVFEQNIDDLNEYVLQGLCKVDDNYCISAYSYNRVNNSIVYIFDKDFKHYRKKELDTNSHVGGITYDPINENIWVTDTEGTISAYSKEELLGPNKKVQPKYKKVYVGEELDNCFGICSVAYITYFDNKLYLGNYNNSDNSIIKEYSLYDSGMIDRRSYRKLFVSDYIQGITFYEDDNDRYLITSSSYGRLFNSKLRIYSVDSLEMVQELNTKEMMEEIIIDDDRLITLYESNARIYQSSREENDIVISNINKILTKR